MVTNSPEKIGKIFGRMAESSGKIGSQIQLFSPIETSVAQSYTDEIESIQSDLAAISGDNWEHSENKDDDIYLKRVVVPHIKGVTGALQAQVDLSTAHSSLTSPEMFAKRLKIDALTIGDLDDVVEDYHIAVGAFFEAQKELNGTVIVTANPQDVSEYKRICQTELKKLDDLATAALQTRVFTESNVDVKENNPHQGFGRINVGYTNTVANLQRILAHEGSFGHQTHLNLSKSQSLNYNFMSLMEGIAIFGEKYALDQIYPDDAADSNAPLKKVLNASRDMNDALMTAYEKLIFHDEADPKEVAKQLASGIVPERNLYHGAKNASKFREGNFSYGATSYYAGSKQVKAMMDSGFAQIEGIKDDKQKAHAENQLLLTLYSGNRPLASARAQIELGMEQIIPNKDAPVSSQISKYQI